MPVWITVAFALGALGGFVGAWLLARGQHALLLARWEAAEQQRAHAEARLEEYARQMAELTTQRAALEERLHAQSDLVEETRRQLEERETRIAQLQARELELSQEATAWRERLSQHEKAEAEKLAVLEQARSQLMEAFKALSADALQQNNQQFLELARTALASLQQEARGELLQRAQAVEEMVRPVRESLEKVDQQLRELERVREHAYASLTQQVRSLQETQDQLRTETAQLVQALRAPSVRGRWGEIQLQRVVEVAGMVEHCDFTQQHTVTTEDGRLRPDLVVHLPGGKHIVVDAKAPLAAYLQALEARTEEERVAYLREHARQIRDHITALGRKSYWAQFEPSPEFVVLFLPGETFFSAAMAQDPELFDTGVQQKVLLATPTTLIALLKAVAYGWRQEALAENARAISQLGRELYKRLADMGEHMLKLGRHLSSAVTSYNQAVGSLESRVLVSARRLRDLHAAAEGEELPSLSAVAERPRLLQAPEFTGGTDSQGTVGLGA